MTMSFTKRAAVAVGAFALALLGSVAVAAPANAAAGNIDPTAVTSFTIHKHQQTGTAATTGTGKSGQTVAGDPIANVTFTVEKVANTDLTTDAGWTEAKAAQSTFASTGNIGSRTKTLVATLKTDASGIATVSSATNANLTKSLYLVTETTGPNNIATKAKPFLVTLPYANGDNTWNYDVHVYPKNGVSALSKADVTTTTDRANSVNTTKFAITTGVPYLSEGTTSFSPFVIADTIDTRYLEFVQAGGVYTTTLTATNAAGTVVTIPAANYTVAAGSVGSLTNAAALELTFNATGLAQLKSDLQGGKLVWTISTNEKAHPTDGAIKNLAGTNINGNTQGTIGGVTASDGEKSATVLFADLVVYTHTNGQALGGAVYALLDAAGNPVKVNGVAVTATADATTGMLTFPNLPVGATGTDYQVQIVSAPAGYNKPATDKVTVNVVAGAPVIPADKTTTTGSKDYAPFAFTQTPAWALPLTGGDGGATFLVAGAGIVTVALGAALVLARRKAKAQTA